MIEQIDKKTPKPRKFAMRYYCARDEYSLCNYIDEHIGNQPNYYEITAIVVKEGYYCVFFKQYIED